MAREPRKAIAISDFKASCFAVLERVRRTGIPVLVTRRGEPIAEIRPPSVPAVTTEWLGSMRGTATITGDLVAPLSAPGEWESLRECNDR